MTTKNIDEVRGLINEKFNDGIKIVSIDGWTGAGKSYLADLLNINESISVISFDDYFEKNKGLYLEVFCYDEIKVKIDEIIAENQKLLIEGICMGQVLEEIDVEDGFKVYVKKVAEYEVIEALYLDENKTIEEIFKEDDEFSLSDILEGYSEIKIDDKDNGKNQDELSRDRRGLFYDL